MDLDFYYYYYFVMFIEGCDGGLWRGEVYSTIMCGEEGVMCVCYEMYNSFK